METELDVSAIVADYGNYYQPSGQGMANLYRNIISKTQFEEGFSNMVISGTKHDMASFSEDEILQAFQTGWTPNGTLLFNPRSFSLYNLKVDKEFYPDNVKATWLGFLAELDSEIERLQWPFARWYVEVHLVQASRDEYNKKISYKAEYVAPTPGTPGTPAASMNGFGKIIADLITSGDVAPIAMGAVPTDPIDFVDYVETFANSIPEDIRLDCELLRMSQDLSTLYSDGYIAKYQKGVVVPNQAANLRTPVRNTNMMVAGFAAMSGKNRIFTAMPSNLLRFTTSKGSPIPKLTKGNNPRGVQVYWDFYKLLSIKNTDEFYCSDQV